MKTRDKPITASTAQNSSYLAQMNMTKWSIKEKLYLVSCVLINGDSNWSKICEQLNKWMKFTSGYYPASTTASLSTTRTNNQCSKQFKFLVNSYAKRHDNSDIKKIYEDLAEERLKELKSQVANNQEDFTTLCAEIEQMLLMETSSFDELTEMWKSIKKNQEFLAKQGIDVDSGGLYEDQAETDLQRDIDRIGVLRKRQEEREAALAIERARALEQQKRLERAKARELEKRLAEEAEVERKRKLAEDKLKAEKDVKEQQSVEIKTERLNSSSNNNTMEMDDLFDKIRTSDMSKPIEVGESGKAAGSSISSGSSDDEIPLNKLKDKAEQASDLDSGIEWKPVIKTADKALKESQKKDTNQAISKTTAGETTQESKSNKSALNQSPNSSTDSDTQAKQKKQKSKRNSRVIDSSTSSSQSSSGSSSDTDTLGDKKKKTTPKAAAAGQTKKEKTELIFTPLITYDKKTAEAKDKAAEAKELEKTLITDDEDEPKRSSPRKSGKTLSDLEKESITEAGTPTTTKGRASRAGRKQKISESAGTTTTPDKATESADDNKTDTTETHGRVGSLRSSNKSRLSSPQLQANKRRSTSTKITKAIDESTSTNKSASASSSLLTTVNHSDSEQSNKAGNNKSTDSGLLSIIKSEPVQISASSTISEATLPTTTGTDNTSQLSISTRQRGNTENPPFSSSSTSSSMSNNSFSSKFEDEKAYRSWKKSIMMVLNNIMCHKHATIFMQPVRDEIAPGYSNVVLRPMDLTTIKKNIETGAIKSTKVFQRDIMLMFTNAIMYNSSNHDVHKISSEMYREVLNDVEQLLHAQENKFEDDMKPSRSKDKRSSTTSDRGVIMAGGNDNESVESEAVTSSNLMKRTRKSSYNLARDETIETASINSNSSVSTKIRGHRLDGKISSPTTSVTSTSANTKKRRPSSSEFSHLKASKEEEPKSKKRRRSGR